MSAYAEAIEAQPAELERLAGVELDHPAAALRGRRLWLVGTGSSQHAVELGAVQFRAVGLDAWAVPSIDFASDRVPISAAQGAVVVSHTGETALARAALARAEGAGLTAVGVTGRGRGWQGAIETVAAERSETYSSSYTAALLVLVRLAAAIAGDGDLEARCRSVATEVERALAAPVPDVGLPERALVYVGAGPSAVTAREGALKLREGARALAEGFDAEYLLHGSAVPLDGRDRLVLLTPSSDALGLVAALGRAAAVAGVAVSEIDPPATLTSVLDQIPLTVRLQRVALRAARARGQDPDRVVVGAWADGELWRLGRPS